MDQGDTGELLNSLATGTEFFSNADLAQLVNKSKQIAFAARTEVLREEYLHEAVCTSGVDRDLGRSEADRFSRFMREYEAEAACMPPMRALAPLLE